MIGEQIGSFFVEQGYTKLPSNLPEFTIYYQMENNYVNVIHVIDCERNLYITEDQYLHIKDKISALFIEKGVATVHILSLVICRELEKAKQLCREDTFCWMIDPYNYRVIIYENQIADFYGIKEKLEYFLLHIPYEDTVRGTEDAPEPERVDKRAVWNEYMGKIPYVTAALTLVNVIVFLICTFTGNLLYNIGAFDAANFIENRQYYRIVTSIFLHGGVNHLVSNMIVLYYLGEVVEKHFGLIRYGAIYLVSGICGNLLSLVYEIYTGQHISTVGASGAIFGVIGALLILVIAHKGHLNQITIGRLMFMISYSLYSGFLGSNINNAAHIGGFLSGMAVSSILWMTGRMKNRPYRNGESYEN